jgi:hypothetical protein
MPPLPTPRSSARWLAYGRADLEGIWNATMIIVSRGHLLAQDQTENRIRCYVLCLFRLLPSQAQSSPRMQDTQARIGEQYSRLSRTEQHQAPYSRSHQQSSTVQATRTPFLFSFERYVCVVAGGGRGAHAGPGIVFTCYNVTRLTQGNWRLRLR